MEKLSDLRGEAALEALGNLLDTLESVAADTELRAAVRGGASRLRCAALVLKKHPAEVLRVLEIIRGEAVSGSCPISQIEAMLWQALEDPAITGLFPSAPGTPPCPGAACTRDTSDACAT